jgi:hypothetical protein
VADRQLISVLSSLQKIIMKSISRWIGGIAKNTEKSLTAPHRTKTLYFGFHHKGDEGTL